MSEVLMICPTCGQSSTAESDKWVESVAENLARYRIAELERENAELRALVAEMRSMGTDVAIRREAQRLTEENAALRADIARYEAHGVTCQTYRNFVSQPCAECNAIDAARKP